MYEGRQSRPRDDYNGGITKDFKITLINVLKDLVEKQDNRREPMEQREENY